MTKPHTAGLVETQARLDTLVSIRFLTGLSRAQQAEYYALTDFERVLLEAHA